MELPGTDETEIWSNYVLTSKGALENEPTNVAASSSGMEKRHMDVRHVRVDPVIRSRVEVVTPGPDSRPVDRVIDRWMTDNGVQNGDVVQAVYVDIHGVDPTPVVWVVVTHSQLVLAVAEPPIGYPLPSWESLIDSAAQLPAG